MSTKRAHTAYIQHQVMNYMISVASHEIDRSKQVPPHVHDMSLYHLKAVQTLQGRPPPSNGLGYAAPVVPLVDLRCSYEPSILLCSPRILPDGYVRVVAILHLTKDKHLVQLRSIGRTHSQGTPWEFFLTWLSMIH